MYRDIGIKLLVVIGMLVFFSAFMGGVFIENIANGEENSLDQFLETIRNKNLGVGTDWIKLEKECLNLLKKYELPEDKGKIYATVAFIYSEKGYDLLNRNINIMEQVSKVVEYCEKALEYPLEIDTACWLYLHLTDALQIKYQDFVGQEFAAARKEIIVPCFKGLKLVLDNQTTQEIEEVPAVGKYDIIESPADPESQKLIKKHNEEIANRKNVMLQNELIRFREAFIQKCISLYSQELLSADEFKRLAEKYLSNHTDVIKELLDAIGKK